MKLHFLLGVLIPYVYPVILAFRLKVAQEAEEAADAIDPLSDLSNSMTERYNEIKEEHEEKTAIRRKKFQLPEKEEVKAEEKPEIEEEIEAEESLFTKRYFEDIAVDSFGAKIGPFKLVMDNGSEFKVCQIKNIKDDIASFEVEVKGELKNIRIKYIKIERFEKI